MPLIIEDEGKLLGKKQAKVPDKLVNKIKQNLNLFGQYKQSKGFKRASSIVDDDYNKRSNKKDKIHNGDKTLSFSDIKKIDHEFKNMSINDDDVNMKNLGYILPGGNDMKTWAHDTLRKMRTAVKKVKGVPPVPKLEKNPLKVPDAQKDIKMGNASVRLTEGYDDDDLHPYYEAMEENGVYEVLNDFLFRTTDKQQWTPLIQPDMYKKALSEFIRFGKFVHFPVKYIYQWIGIIMNNTAKLRANTELAGHDSFFPIDELKDVMEQHPDKFADAIKKYGNINDEKYYENAYEILDYIGLYDWMNMPDGSDAWSDFGLPSLEKVIAEYKEGMTPEETIVIINKALDCAHPRGDLSSIFIVGGSRTLSAISESVKRNKKIIVNENQLLALKEYHDQLVFNFDDEGNAYFEKNNWEHYVDFLEEIGTPGQLPPSEWNETTIEQKIESIKQEIDYNSDDISTYDYESAFLDLVYNSFLEEKENVEAIFEPEFLSYFNNYKANKYSYQDLTEILYSNELMNDEENLDRYLTAYGYKKYQEYIKKTFTNHINDYNMLDNVETNDRGLIYVERNIMIPNFNSPEFSYNGSKNYYNYLKKMYYNLGYCFSWGKEAGEAYCGHTFGLNGTSEIKLKCWVDPKDINWYETVYRNCYSLNEEKEVYIDESGAKIEVFDVVLEHGKINGQNVSGKSLMKTPIIIEY